MQKFRFVIPMTGVFFLALIVRVVYNLTVGRNYIIEFDAEFYYKLALGLMHYHCYCDYGGIWAPSRAPLWPAIMFVIFKTMHTTDSLDPRLFLSLLGSGTCVITALLASDIFGRRIGLITGIIAAVYPGLFIWDGWLYSESVYTFFLTAFVFALYRFQRSVQPVQETARPVHLSLALLKRYFWPGLVLLLLIYLSIDHLNNHTVFVLIVCWSLIILWSIRTNYFWAMIAGVSLVLASYVRPNGVLLLSVAVIWACLVVQARVLSKTMALRGILLIFVLSILLIGPWTWTNYRQYHRFILIATGSGTVLTGVYNDEAVLPTRDQGMWIPPETLHPPIFDSDRLAPARTWILSHMSEMPLLLWLHFRNMWIPYTSEEGLPFIEFPNLLSSQIVFDLLWLMTPLIIFGATLGLIVTWKHRKNELILIYLVLLFTVISNIVFYGNSRFRAPIEPLLVLSVGGLLWWLSSKKHILGSAETKGGFTGEKGYVISPESKRLP